jgi:ketosteroid isomerase-like protein
MNQKLLCFAAVFLFSCAAAAQNPAPPASPGNEATTTTGPAVPEFQQIVDKWDSAVNARDQYSLELVLSPLFVGISATGDVTTRNQQLAGVISEQDKTMHLEQRVISVRLLGDTAVANGTYVLHHKVNGSATDEKGVFTHVFEKQRNGWVCVNSQRTLLREAQSKGKKKQSQGDLPFHFPLFSK